METLNVIPTATAGQALLPAQLVTARLNSARIVEQRDEDKNVIATYISLSFVGIPQQLLRTVKQASGDMIDYLTKAQRERLTADQARIGYLKFFSDKDITFVASAHEAGAIQTLTAESALVVNGVINPTTNKAYQVGEPVETKTDGVWVDGFLSVKLTKEEIDDLFEKAFAVSTSTVSAEAAYVD